MTATIAETRIDPRTGRPLGDHGTGGQAIDWVLNHSNDDDAYNLEAFLKAWQEGGAFEEWPEFYEWLALQPVPATAPEGWQLVPVEPVREMWAADVWTAMLAAAPTAPEA